MIKNCGNIETIDKKHYDRIHDFMITTFPDIYPDPIKNPEDVFAYMLEERESNKFENIFSSQSIYFDVIKEGEFKGFILYIDSNKSQLKIFDTFSLDNHIAASEMSCEKDIGSFSLIELEFINLNRPTDQSGQHDAIVRILHTLGELSCVTDSDVESLRLLVFKYAGTGSTEEKQNIEESIMQKINELASSINNALTDFENAHIKAKKLIEKHQENLNDLFGTLEDILALYSDTDPVYGVEKSTYQFMKTKLITRKIELIRLELEPYKSFREAMTNDIEDMVSLSMGADYSIHMQRLQKLILTARTLNVAHSISQLYIKLASTHETIDVMALSDEITSLIDYLISNFGVIQKQTLESSYQYQQIMDILQNLLNILSKETRQLQKKKVASLLEEIVASLKKIAPSAIISENKEAITSMVVRLRVHIVENLMEILSNTDFTLLFKESV